MKRIISLFVILVMVMAFSAGCGKKAGTTAERTVPPGKTSSMADELAGCEGRSGTMYAMCLAGVAEDFEDSSICGRIPTDMAANKVIISKCFKDVAKAKLDATICQSIKEDIVQRYNCIQDVAEEKEDPAVCSLLFDDASEDIFSACIRGVAVAKKDASVCEPLRQIKDGEEIHYPLCVEKVAAG